MKYLKITLLVLLFFWRYKKKKKKALKKNKKKKNEKKNKKSSENDQSTGHFQSFFIYFFFVPPTLNLKKISRKSTNKKILALRQILFARKAASEKGWQKVQLTFRIFGTYVLVFQM